MKNTNSTNIEPVGESGSDVPKEIQDALNMPDAEYILALESHIANLMEANIYGRAALETFVELLEFIGENFGNTKDFPIRIDNDFYEDVFVEKLTNCQQAVESFFEKFEEDFEQGDLTDEDVF